MQKPIINISNLSIKRYDNLILHNTNCTIYNNQHLLITGNSGSGKTSLGMAIAGKLFFEGTIEFNFPITTNSIIFVDQLYNFKSKSGVNDFYYQQRYNSYDAQDSATVKELLLDHDSTLIDELFLTHRLDAPLIQLSSGERKKIQLIQALHKQPQVLILDNPYIGLDQASVINLNNLFTRLAANGTTFIFLGERQQTPAFISHIATIANQTVMITPKIEYTKPASKTLYHSPNITLPEPKHANFNKAIEFSNINITYGTKQILKDINWVIHKGEKWLLQGANGAGKTTLLSLVNGDHPQSYTNDIRLFDKQRGSGESIWEIKQKIGFVAPELHWNFNYNISCLNVVVSGLYDTLGLYKKPKAEELEIAKEYLKYLNLANYTDKLFLSVATGIQRMVLIARALVKNPPLLIFDEPCQGLDDNQTQLLIQLIDNLFVDTKHTLIYVSHRQDQIPKCITHKLCI